MGHRAFAERFYHEWNCGNMEAVYDMLAPDIVDHAASEGEAGREGVRQVLDTVRRAFPDHHYTVEDVISEGDKFAVRLTATGTHLGDFFGIPPTGRHATWTETRIVRVVDGKVVDHWANTDSLGMLRQLGVLPEPGRANW